jgi:hypothetical protein
MTETIEAVVNSLANTILGREMMTGEFVFQSTAFGNIRVFKKGVMPI